MGMVLKYRAATVPRYCSTVVLKRYGTEWEVGNKSKGSSMTTNVIVVNQKGGVGKTTFADEIAWGLERRGVEVGFGNLDRQGGACHEVGMVEGGERRRGRRARAARHFGPEADEEDAAGDHAGQPRVVRGHHREQLLR